MITRLLVLDQSTGGSSTTLVDELGIELVDSSADPLVFRINSSGNKNFNYIEYTIFVEAYMDGYSNTESISFSLFMFVDCSNTAGA